jgi:hypothetical protein
VKGKASLISGLRSGIWQPSEGEGVLPPGHKLLLHDLLLGQAESGSLKLVPVRDDSEASW